MVDGGKVENPHAKLIIILFINRMPAVTTFRQN